MTAEQKTEQRDHPGVVALREKIRLAEAGLDYLEKAATTDVSAEVRRIESEIEELRTQLSFVTRRRDEAVARLDARREEVARLRSALDMCLSDSRVATAVWMKLLMDRKKKR